MNDDTEQGTETRSSSTTKVVAKVDETEHVPPSALMEPMRHVGSLPGKDVRGRLVDCFQSWFRVPSDGTLEAIKEIVRDLHDASLLVDDVEDNSRLRRGVPVAHVIFGVAPVINCANYAYFLATERCRSLGNDEAMRVFCAEMLNLHRGQGHDIMWRDNHQCPTEEEYCQMVVDKTGGLFRLAVGLMRAFATENASVDYVPLVDRLGLYFQIRDDLVNLADPEYHKSKSFCEDLTEGKFSFPILHCVRAGVPTNDTRLLSILKQRTDDADVKAYARELMRAAGSLSHARRRCGELRTEIETIVAELGGNPPLLQLLATLDAQVEGLEDVDRPGGSVSSSSPLKRHGSIDSA